MHVDLMRPTVAKRYSHIDICDVFKCIQWKEGLQITRQQQTNEKKKQNKGDE